MTTCLAVDVGGTKLAAGLVGRQGEVLTSARVATPRTTDPDELFAALEDLVEGVRSEAPGDGGAGAPEVCGVGCGGPMDRHAGTVSPLNIPAWRGFPLRARLAQATGLRVVLDNDAKAFALGEGWTGAAAGVRDFVAMVVSTGVGGGVVSGGSLLEGATGNGGHIGHVIVEPDGRRCGCGAHGCLEAEASGTAIEAVTGRLPQEASPEVVTRTGRLVGRAVASVAAVLDLELVVVGGSVALGFGAPFFAAANDELAARARLSFLARARIVPSALGAAGSLVGAGALGWRALAVEP